MVDPEGSKRINWWQSFPNPSWWGGTSVTPQKSSQNFRQTAKTRWVGFKSLSSKRLSKISPKIKKTNGCWTCYHFSARKGNIYVQIFNCDGKVPAIVWPFFSQYTFCKGLGPEMVTNLTLHSTKYKHGWNFTNGFRYHESYPKSTPENSSLLATMFGR